MIGRFALLLFPFTLTASAAQPDVRLEIRFAPRIDRTNTGNAARYELHVINRGVVPLRLRELNVRDHLTGRVFLNLAGASLGGVLALGQPGCNADSGLLAAGGDCILYIDAVTSMRWPRVLDNRLDFLAGDRPGHAVLRAKVVDDVVTDLGPPLGAGNWVAVHSPDWPRGHRRVFYPAKGGEVLPGRFAIDFVGVSTNGATSQGQADDPQQAIGYGAPVLAVADGRIAAVRDGVAESARISANRAHDRSTAAGNYVVLALSSGRFATYEHLRPGSIRVRTGDPIRRGAVLGALGFTGDSTGPHLHFHVSNSVQPLDGEGLPFTFSRFRLLGSYPDIAQLGLARWREVPVREVKHARPGANSVLSFGR